MNRLSRILVIFLMVSTAVGCHNAQQTQSSDAADSIAYTPVSVQRFDLDAYGYGIAQSDSLAHKIIGQYPAVIDFLKVIDGRHGESADVDALRDYAQSQVLQVFLPDVQKRLPDLSTVEDQLGQLKARMDARFSADLFPKAIVGFETPYNQKVILLADTVALVGLNHYLGAEYPGYAGFADYQRVLNVPERIVVDMAEAIVSTHFPYRPGGSSTVLSRLVYEGALLHALHQLMPQVPLHLIMGYSPEQLAEAERTQKSAWQQLARQGTLYDIDPMQADRLVSPAPYTQPLGPNSVPRMGRYIGYNLVENYLKNNGDIALQSLLQPSFYAADSTVVRSKYAGN